MYTALRQNWGTLSTEQTIKLISVHCVYMTEDPYGRVLIVPLVWSVTSKMAQTYARNLDELSVF